MNPTSMTRRHLIGAGLATLVAASLPRSLAPSLLIFFGDDAGVKRGAEIPNGSNLIWHHRPAASVALPAY